MKRKKLVKYVVLANYGIEGWQPIKVFRTWEEAVEWLDEYVRENGYWSADFNIIRREF